MNFQDPPESSFIFKHTLRMQSHSSVSYVIIVSNTYIIISTERYLLISDSVWNPATIPADNYQALTVLWGKLKGLKRISFGSLQNA